MVIAPPKTTGEFYDHLLHTVAAGVLILNEAGIVTSANSAAGRILGWEAEQLIGRTWTDLGAETDNLAECPPYQTTLRQPDGRSITVNLAITPVSDHVTSSTMVSFTNGPEVEQLNEALLHTQRLAGIDPAGRRRRLHPPGPDPVIRQDQPVDLPLRLGNLGGVIAAGLGLGAAENIAGFVLGAQYQLAFVFLLLVVVLLWRNWRLSRKRQYLK